MDLLSVRQMLRNFIETSLILNMNLLISAFLKIFQISKLLIYILHGPKKNPSVANAAAFVGVSSSFSTQYSCPQKQKAGKISDT